ncbi:MAG: tyrosine-protein phosphatase [Candidatus Coproplasma sp.]
MIDVHSHILWGVDDGADSATVSQEMLSQYVEQGVDCVICTPHQNKMLHRADILRHEFAVFKEKFKNEPITFHLGAEILYYEGMAKDISNGELLTLGDTNYVLIEFNVGCSCEDVCDAVYELKIANYLPIIAHIERYVNLTKKDYSVIRELGALIQINAGALRCKRTTKVAKYLLKKGLVDFIATDCHDADHRNVDFSEIREFVKKKYPAQYDKLFNRQVHI